MENKDIEKNFSEWNNRLRRYVFSIVRDNSETDDILQEVWITLFKKQEQYDPARPFIVWATGIARMQIMKWRQEKGRDRLVFAEDTINLLTDTLISELEADEDNKEKEREFESLADGIEKIGPYGSQILKMKYMEGLKIDQIAKRLGKSVGSIEMALTRARRELKDLIG